MFCRPCLPPLWKMQDAESLALVTLCLKTIMHHPACLSASLDIGQLPGLTMAMPFVWTRRLEWCVLLRWESLSAVS